MRYSTGLHSIHAKMICKAGLMFGLVVILSALFMGAFGWSYSAYAADVVYPASQFADGKAKFFTYKTPEGLTIKYFVVKSSDGIIRAAFDACDVCWPERKGYTQKGDFMVCNNCGRQFQTTRVNVVTGGCNPGALTRNVENEKVIIHTDDILKGKRYFDLKGGRG